MFRMYYHNSLHDPASRTLFHPPIYTHTHTHTHRYLIKILSLQFGADLTFAVVSSRERGVAKAFGVTRFPTFLVAVSVHDGDPNLTKKAKMSVNIHQGKTNYKSLKEFLIPWIARSRTLVAQASHASIIKTPRPERLKPDLKCKDTCVIVRLGGGGGDGDDSRGKHDKYLSALRDAMIDARDASSHLNRFDPFKIPVLWSRSLDSHVLQSILPTSNDTIAVVLDMATCRGATEIFPSPSRESFQTFLLNMVVSTYSPHRTWPELQHFCEKNSKNEL